MNQQSPRQSVLHQILSVLKQKASGQAKQQVQAPQRPAPEDRDAWQAYWKAQSQPWRTEPEINTARQKELAQCRAVSPDVEKGIYPFKGMKLSRADVEWLLATHENGRGPVDLIIGGDRQGLDMRGANLSQQDLHALPLARIRGGLALDEWMRGTEEQREMAEVNLQGAILQEANLWKADLCGADIGEANLQEAYLVEANLQEAYLGQTNLQKALLPFANLQGVDLGEADLQKADLMNANLQGARLWFANLQEAILAGTNLQEAYLVSARIKDAYLEGVALGNEKQVGPQLVDCQWGDSNLAVIEWSLVKMLGDEYEAKQKKTSGGIIKEKGMRLSEYKAAARANRQLAVALQGQGLNEEAAHFAYRAQVLQKSVLRYQLIQQEATWGQRMRALGAWLFSWFLFLLAGYGYRAWRSFAAYILVISGFATAYYLLGLHDVVGPHHVFGPYHLTWYEAIVVSMTAFHGRGFFANQFQPGDPQAFVAALEAFVGLIIEVTFIATLTRRLFGQ